MIVSIRYYYDSGDFYTLRNALAALALLFDRLEHYEVAATMSGFADTPFTRSVVPEISTAITHLRKVLGDETYESFARNGGMTGWVVRGPCRNVHLGVSRPGEILVRP